MASQDLSGILTEAERDRQRDRASAVGGNRPDSVPVTPSLDPAGQVPLGQLPMEQLRNIFTGSGSAASYLHQQADPADEWLIAHMLGGRPTVEVLIGGKQVEGYVPSWPDLDHVIIRFGRPFAGVAQLNL